MLSSSESKIGQVWPEATTLREFIQHKSHNILTEILEDYFSTLRQEIYQVVDNLKATEKRLMTEVTSLRELLLEYTQRLDNTKDFVT